MSGNSPTPHLHLGYLIAFFAFLTLGLLAAPGASAQEYGPGKGFVVSPGSVNPGDDFDGSGSGCDAGTTVTLFLGSAQVGTATAAADGTFETTMTVPLGTPAGPQTVTATCGECVQIATLQVVLSGTGSTGDPGTGTGDEPPGTLAFAPEGGELAQTGSNTETIARVAILFVAVGVILMLVARREERDHHVHGA